MIGGIVSATLRRRAGWRRRAAMSSSGNGRPRSRPNARSRRRPPPTTCRSGRCSRCSACRARRARTCRAGRPSRWSASRRRTRRPRRARACAAAAADPDAILSSASSQPTGTRCPAALRTSGVDQALGMRERVAGGPALDAERAGVDGKLRRRRRSTTRRPARATRAARIGRHSTDSVCEPHCSSRCSEWIVPEGSYAAKRRPGRSSRQTVRATDVPLAYLHKRRCDCRPLSKRMATSGDGRGASNRSRWATNMSVG